MKSETLHKDPVPVVCLDDIMDLYQPLIHQVSMEVLHYSLESQHLAELYVFTKTCITSRRTLHITSNELSKLKGELQVYIPTLPLIAYRILGPEESYRLMNLTYNAINSINLYQKNPDMFHMVCNHWGAPYMMKPFDFTDDGVAVGTISPILHTYENEYMLEMQFETLKQFSQRTRAVPYVENTMNSDVFYSPLRRKNAFLFAGSVKINSNTDNEKHSSDLRRIIKDLSVARDDVVVMDTSYIRTDSTRSCSAEEAKHTYETWTVCSNPGYGEWQWHKRDLGKQLKLDTAMTMPLYNFCLIPRGDTPGTSRYYDAVAMGCLPVIICDDFPFPTAVDDAMAFVYHIKEANFIADAKGELDKIVNESPLDVLETKRDLMKSYARNVLHKQSHEFIFD